MSQPNGQFNPERRYGVPEDAQFSGAYEAGETALSDTVPTPSEPAESGIWDRIKGAFKGPVRQATTGAMIYGLQGLGDLQAQNEYYGTPENAPLTFLFIMVVVGLPTFLMSKRKGYISAGVLCGVALVNLFGVSAEISAGNELYSEGAVLWHLLASLLFARAAWHLWKNRKSEA